MLFQKSDVPNVLLLVGGHAGERCVFGPIIREKNLRTSLLSADQDAVVTLEKLASLW